MASPSWPSTTIHARRRTKLTHTHHPPIITNISDKDCLSNTLSVHSTMVQHRTTLSSTLIDTHRIFQQHHIAARKRARHVAPLHVVRPRSYSMPSQLMPILEGEQLQPLESRSPTPWWMNFACCATTKVGERRPYPLRQSRSDAALLLNKKWHFV